MKFKVGKFRADINEVHRLLTKLNILEERNYYPELDFNASEYRSKTYIENWKSLLSSNIYDLLLVDNSSFHFKVPNKNKISYSYFECPYKCLSYLEFLQENELIENNDDDERTFYDYYEHYLTDCSAKESFTMIRYDYDDTSYCEGIHPISHIHIGFKNQIRIGLDKVLSPLNFTAFVLRQHYPGYWKKLMEKKEWISIYPSLKNADKEVHKSFWNKGDKHEHFLT